MESQINWSDEPDLPRLRLAYLLLTTEPARGIAELTILADMGSFMSMIYLGDAYSFGQNATKNLGEAEKWYVRAISSGQPRAQYSLGRFYLELGRDVEARQAFIAGAASDYVPAIDFLGRMYAYGKGGEKNLEKAEELLKYAYKKGSLIAKGALGRVLIRSYFRPLRIIRGIWLYTSAFIAMMFVFKREGEESAILY